MQGGHRALQENMMMIISWIGFEFYSSAGGLEGFGWSLNSDSPFIFPLHDHLACMRNNIRNR
jgi:hypothetical protein